MSQLLLAAEAARGHSINANATAQAAANATPADAARVTETAITALTKYIPTEVVTLYIASVSALPAIQEEWKSLRSDHLYFGFAMLTPILFVLIFFNQLAVDQKPYPTFRQWPWWRIFASTIAFCVWALAVPNNPFLETKTAGVLAGLGAAFVSMLLSIIGPIVERR